MLSVGVEQEKVDRIPRIQKLKESNVRKGFFEHHDFLALGIALPFYLEASLPSVTNTNAEHLRPGI